MPMKRVMAENKTEEAIEFDETRGDDTWHRVVLPGKAVEMPKKILKDIKGLEEA